MDARSVSRFTTVLAHPSRTAMCLALLDGRAWTAGELARHAAVARSTASEHLSALVDASVLEQLRQGRHRYLRLAGAGVAQLLEDLAAVSGQPTRPVSLRTARSGERLAAARVCYDHLAGAFGVDVLERLVAAGLLATADGVALTPRGRRWFADLAGESVLGTASSRPFLRLCLDWTERRSHLGGRLGAVLLDEALGRGWVARVDTLPRALTVTAAGRHALTTLDRPTSSPPEAPPRAAPRQAASDAAPDPSYGPAPRLSRRGVPDR